MADFTVCMNRITTESCERDEIWKELKNSRKLAHFIFQFSWINQSWFNREELCSQIDVSGGNVRCWIPFSAQATSEMIKPLSQAVGPFHHSGNINAIFRMFWSQEVQFPHHLWNTFISPRIKPEVFVWLCVLWFGAVPGVTRGLIDLHLQSGQMGFHDVFKRGI